MTIMDEASQCNVAISLVPIIRGEKLMLVGDPQQLNPVILLGELINRKLRRRYHVAEEYDYRKNSIYKTYLACDAVSDEVLLRSHYRCNREIIGFNNKKYYNSKLQICSKSKEPEPLVYVDVKSDRAGIKKYISGGSRRGHCIREAEHGQKYRGDHTVCKPAGTDRAGDQRKPPRKFSLWNGACFSGR